MTTRPVTAHRALRLAVRVGHIFVVATGGVLSTVASAASWRDRDGMASAAGNAVGDCVWRLGPAFVKAAQMLSSRRDVLPGPFCDRLARQVALGGSDGSAAHRPSWLLAASANGAGLGSIASVRKVADGPRTLAVKSLHPGAVDRMDLDLDIMTSAAWLVGVLAPSAATMVRGVVAEMCAAVGRQVDLVAEAATLRRLAELEQTLPIVFPRIVDDESDERHITMTWLDGQDDGRSFPNPQRTARQLVLTVYEMLFVTGLVHCDLHPGNWWELPDGRLAIVDAGFSYLLDDEMRMHFAEFFLGMASGNAETCATHALAAAAEPVPPYREASFRRDMAELIDSTTGMTAGDFSLTGFAARFFAIQRRHSAYSRAEFIFPFMALLAIEGQVKELDPSINFQALAGRVVLRAVVNRARYGTSDSARLALHLR